LCKENYLITRSKQKEDCFIISFNNDNNILYWVPLSFIWVSSLIIGDIDAYANKTSIQKICLDSMESQFKFALESNALCIFGYYQSLGTFSYSILMLFLIKSLSMCLVYQRCKYYRLMLIYDLFYILSIMLYPLLIYITYKIQIIEWLCILGTLGIFINIPINVLYLKKHNAVLKNINLYYGDERIMNWVETPTLSP